MRNERSLKCQPKMADMGSLTGWIPIFLLTQFKFIRRNHFCAKMSLFVIMNSYICPLFGPARCFRESCSKAKTEKFNFTPTLFIISTDMTYSDLHIDPTYTHGPNFFF